jgi:CubicO group peptidase (beta-lactamase class C family)
MAEDARAAEAIRVEDRATRTGRYCKCLAWSMLMLLGALVTGCGAGAGDTAGSCPAAATLEAQMDSVLSQAASAGDFSFAVERLDGRRYTFNRGSSTLQTSYESKSTSKLISAVIILRLVEQGYLALSERPQDRIVDWPIASPNPLSDMTLAQLLSFTSGLTIDPPCLGIESSAFEACVISVGTENLNNPIAPGQEFFYASSHLQVAGLMAIKARGVASWTWQEVYAEFKAQTGLFLSSSYDSPSLSNPALAGGMHLTGRDYMDFLKALKGGLLLNTASMSQLLADHTMAPMPMRFSPIFSGIGGGAGLGEDWHYGFGLWHECQSPTFNCVAGTRVSSPGALGFYPFWDRSKGYTGVVARDGAFGTLTSGINIERSVRPNVEQWAAC